jgi:hypothetical protein
MSEITLEQPKEQKIPRIYENAIDKMVAEMPKGLTELEQARYIYINLGKLLAYDERYTVGNNKQQRRLFRLAKERTIEFNQIKENKKFKGICIDLNRLYANTLISKLGMQRVGINYGYGIMPHDSVTAEFDGRTSSYDLQRDLINIQLNCMTDFFGFHDYGDDYCDTILKDDEIAEIDKKLNFQNYNYSGRPYIRRLREKFESIYFYDHENEESFNEHLRFKSLSFKEKIEEMLHDISTIPGIKNLAYTERTRVYWKMLKYGLEYRDERKNFRIDNLYTVDSEGLPKEVVEIFTAVYDENNVTKHSRYVYDHVKKEYVSISNRELLDRIETEGLTSKKKIFSAVRKIKKETKQEERAIRKILKRIDRDPMDQCNQTLNIGERPEKHEKSSKKKEQDIDIDY